MIKNPIDQFKQAIEAAGLTAPDVIHDDGAIHRFSTSGKSRDDSGWYSLHTDGIPAGSFGCWREGMQSTWCAKSDTAMTPDELGTHRQRIKAMQAQRETEQAARQQSAATDAAQRLAAANACTEHAYTTAKGVQCHGVKVESDGFLIVPMRDTAGKLWNIERINPADSKDKKGLYGGRRSGLFHAIGKPKGLLIVGEGYATCASIHEATGHAVAVAFNAGNLEPVALALRAKYPALKIIIAADDDHLTDGNPGLIKARAAALSVGGLVAVPSFPADRPDKATDFNDMHKLAGADAVRICIDGFINSAAPEAAQEDEFIDLHRNAPRPSPVCLYGLVGEIARAGSADTEANAFAIAGAMLAYLGAAVGRGPFMPIGDTWNHARLFMVHVGRSSRGRKGTAKSLVLRIAKSLEAMDKHLSPQIHRGGLSTREGLALMIHDGWIQGKEEIPAIDDKRLLVVESEFANILHQSKRDGNTLSSALRDAWDGVSIKPAIKTSRVWATDPHIAMIGDVTPSELRELMHTRELTNGFANRFIFFWAEGDKVNPFPKPTPIGVVDDLAARVAEVLRFAGADRYAEKDVHRMELSPDSAKLYAKLYRGELRDRSSGESIAGLLDRRAPVLLRLAMLFALTDQTYVITPNHISAALAWVRYWVDSVKFVFQSAVDEAGAAEVSETADKIVAYLADREQATRTELSKGCFGGHVSKDKLDKALDELLTATPPAIEVDTIARQKGQPGSSTKYYKPYAKSAKSAEPEHSCGLEPDLTPLRNVRTLRNVESESTLSENAAIPEFAQFAEFADHQNHAETRMDIDTSQNSHISQGTMETCLDAAIDEEVF